MCVCVCVCEREEITEEEKKRGKEEQQERVGEKSKTDWGYSRSEGSRRQTARIESIYCPKKMRLHLQWLGDEWQGLTYVLINLRENRLDEGTLRIILQLYRKVIMRAGAKQRKCRWEGSEREKINSTGLRGCLDTGGRWEGAVKKQPQGLETRRKVVSVRRDFKVIHIIET